MIEGQIETIIVRNRWIVQKTFIDGEWRITTTVPYAFDHADMERAEREALKVFIDEIEAEK